MPSPALEAFPLVASYRLLTDLRHLSMDFTGNRTVPWFMLNPLATPTKRPWLRSLTAL